MKINYYEENFVQYIRDTIECDMSEQYNLFLKHINPPGKILDVGFGSGRDMKFFKSKGFKVFGIDSCKSFCDAIDKQKFNIENIAVEDFNARDTYNGIWACASLLHVKKEDLYHVFYKLLLSLKDGGILYASFKYGNFEKEINGRYFNYINEEIIVEIVKKLGIAEILEILLSSDVREDRKNETWINVILRKK